LKTPLFIEHPLILNMFIVVCYTVNLQSHVTLLVISEIRSFPHSLQKHKTHIVKDDLVVFKTFSLMLSNYLYNYL